MEAEDGWTNEEESRADLGLLRCYPAWHVGEEKNGGKNGRTGEKRRKRKKWKWGGKMETEKEEGIKREGQEAETERKSLNGRNKVHQGYR